MKYYIKRLFFTLLEAAFLTLCSFLYCYRWQPQLITLFTKPFSKEIFYINGTLVLFFLFLLFVFVSRRLFHRIRLWQIRHFSLHRIDKMSGQDFEKYLKAQFEHFGFTVEETKISNDYGADLILHKKNLTIAVQAKRYRASIGVKAVQEVIGSMAYYEADKGLVVTNSFFTHNAKELAMANQVILWDRDVFTRLLAKEPMNGYLNELLEP